MQKKDLLEGYFEQARNEQIDFPIENIEGILSEANVGANVGVNAGASASSASSSALKTMLIKAKFWIWTSATVFTAAVSVIAFSLYVEAEGQDLNNQQLAQEIVVPVSIDDKSAAEDLTVSNEIIEANAVEAHQEKEIQAPIHKIKQHRELKANDSKPYNKTLRIKTESSKPTTQSTQTTSQVTVITENEASEVLTKLDANEIQQANEDINLLEEETPEKYKEKKHIGYKDVYEKQVYKARHDRIEARSLDVMRSFKFFRTRQKVWLLNSENTKVYRDISLLVYNNNRWAKVKKKNKYGFIDEFGIEIVKPEYHRIFQFATYHRNWAMVEKKSKKGFIDRDGQEVIKPQYDKIFFFDVYREGWAMVKKDGLYGFIDTTGSEIVEPIYRDIHFFNEKQDGWAEVYRNGKYGFVDEFGKEVVEVVYDKIYFFDTHRKNWAMVIKDGKYGFIDLDGNEVVKPKYDKIDFFDMYKDGWSQCMLDGKYGYIDSEGNEIIEPKYDRIYHFDENKKEWAKVKLKGKYGFIDETGKEIIKPIYKKVGYFGEKTKGKIEVKSKEGYLLLDENGK
jgi:hypothetical protein